MADTQGKIVPASTYYAAWIENCFQAGVLLLPLSSEVGVALLLLAVIGVWKHQYRAILDYRLNWGFAGLSVWLILTACFAFKPLEAFIGLANFLPYFAVFAAFSLLLQKPSQLRRLAWYLVLPSLAIVILGLGQLGAGWESLPWLRWLGLKLVAYGNPTERMSSLFMYANTLAFYLLTAFILGLGLWIETYQRWRWGSSKRSRSQLAWLSLTVLGDGAGLILTNSRNAWGLALLACLAFALYLGWRWLVLGVAIAAASVGWAAWGSFGRDTLRQIVPAFFWARVSDELYTNRPLATLRTTQWHFAWNMFLQRPWTGWGLRNFTPLYEQQMAVYLGHPHNLFLMLLSETGLLATLLLCGLVGWVMFQAVRVLAVWSTMHPRKARQPLHRNSLILFTYLVAFSGCILFNLFDVSIFDLKVSLLGWLVFSALGGIVYRDRMS
jgi:O-antigen ligase